MEKIHSFIFIVSFVLLSVTLFPAATWAQENAENQAVLDTRIETSDEDDTIRFFVKGEEIMRIDAGGLHVNGNVEYSGRSMDTGTYDSDNGGSSAHETKETP